MKTISRRSALALALISALTLAACGGGGGDSGTTAVTVYDTATLQITDTVAGTGPVAATGNTLAVNYTGWLYNPTAANNRGAQFDTSVGKTTFQFKLGAGSVIQGWDQGLVGMKVGGTRTLLIPSRLAYGANAVGGVIPANSALVFSVDLVAVQ
jgi:FKBP-type peptidyl-prolyl cis-trans isomerase FkpA